MNAADRVEDRSQAAAQFVIVAIVEGLKIHFVKVHPGPQIFEHLGRGVAVGDEAGDQTGRARLAKNRHRPFASDERLVVGADHACGAGRARGFHDLARRDSPEIQRRAEVAQGLRRDPVLAVSAVQVATQHAEAERARSRQGVKERLLLDGVGVQRAHIAVRHVELAAPVVAHLADAREAGRNRTTVAAGIAPHAPRIQRFVEFPFADLLRELLSHGLHIRPSTAKVYYIAGRL